MPALIAFSEEKDAVFPKDCLPAMQVWGDINRACCHDMLGTAEFQGDGVVKADYGAFEITLKPDGTFHGKRKCQNQKISQNI